MNFTNPMNGYQMGGNMYGMPYQQVPPQQQMPTMKNLLTQEEMNSLKREKYVLALRPEDIMRNKCTHKKDNTFALVPDPEREGYQRCTICGKSFKVDDTNNIHEVQSELEPVVNVIETIKTLGVELPLEFLNELAKMESVLEILPAVHHEVMKTWFEKYDRNGQVGYQNNGNGATNLFNYLSTGGGINPYLANNPYAYGGAMGYQAQPVYGGFNQMQQQPPVQQQMYTQPQQPVAPGYPQMGNQQPVGGSPFYAQQPVQQQYAYSQPPVQPQQQPVAPQQVQPQQQTQQQQVKEPTPAPSYQPPVANQTDKSAVVTKQMNV